MGTVRKINFITELEALNYTFKVDDFFGVNNEARFYHIRRIEQDGSLVVDVYAINNDEATMTSKNSTGYTISAFKYRNEQEDLWFNSIAPVKIIDNEPKKERKVYNLHKSSKPVNTDVSESQGKLFKKIRANLLKFRKKNYLCFVNMTTTNEKIMNSITLNEAKFDMKLKLSEWQQEQLQKGQSIDASAAQVGKIARAYLKAKYKNVKTKR